MMKNKTSKYSEVACATSSLAREIGPWLEETASAPTPASGVVPCFAPEATGGNRLARTPTVMATLSVMPSRSATIVQLPWNAKAVETRTTGLTTGAARMNVVAAYRGTPLARRRRASGITPQSHTGARKPKTLLTKTSGSRCRGNQRVSTPSERYCWTNAEAKTPTSRKGSDCRIMLTNTTLKSLRRDGSTSARTMALHFDSGCPFPSGRVPTGAAQPYADRPRRTRTHAEFDSIGASAPQARRPGTVVSSTASTKASGVRGPRAGSPTPRAGDEPALSPFRDLNA